MPCYLVLALFEHPKFTPDQLICAQPVKLGSLLLEGERNNSSRIVVVFRDSTTLPWCDIQQHLPLTSAASMSVVNKMDDIGNASKRPSVC